MRALPLPAAVTSPLSLTVATVSSLLDHSTAAPAMGWSLPSSTAALS